MAEDAEELGQIQEQREGDLLLCCLSFLTSLLATALI